jgi:hypothetical protein
MTITPLSQRDPRWAKKALGFSKLSIGGYGCTITSLAMLISRVENREVRVDEVNEKLKSVKAFSGALLLWSRVPLAYPSLKFIKRAYNYSNADAAFNIYIKGVPVMVEVSGAKIGAPRHWVLFKGGGKANDPWTGKEISTSYYPLTGYSVFSKK